ncbi:MAG: arginyltransferase [Epsilonproteobacteria bacterium]|nr:arginyltransferase [Campylobacterota bacterium]
MLDYECAYIPENKVRMNYKYVRHATPEFNSAVIKRGWRRFGCYYFHPICEGCNECKSLRIHVNDFKLSKSQKKSKSRNKETRIIVQKPTLSYMHLDLYNKYHDFKSDKDGWKQKDITTREYIENFVEGAGEFGKEVLYIRDEKLIGVDLIDVLEDGISSIYFFYDPDYARLSLGTYSLLYQIELAKLLELEWIYLGYWVEGCKAFAYKTNFTPQQLLDGFPKIEEEPLWIPPESSKHT